jgi:hypothetical protein
MGRSRKTGCKGRMIRAGREGGMARIGGWEDHERQDVRGE